MASAAASSPISYLSASSAAEIDEKLMGSMGYSLDQLMVSACRFACGQPGACCLGASRHECVL